jgi:serine/threonine protein kinase
MFAKDLVKKILMLDPKKRLKIESIIKHPWFKQNKVDLSKSNTSFSPEKKDEAFEFSKGKNQSGFNSYIKERIAESIMPGSEFKISGVEVSNQGSPA